MSWTPMDSIKQVQDFVKQVYENVEQVIVGKRDVIELLMVALLCEGHVLLEDVPGVGKTMLARSIAISLGGEFKRLQCTPDLLPNDVIGVSVYNQQNGQFEFRPGPIFVNILLADEINRATPRTQSALLEAMQEQQVTVDGTTRLLPRPFLVLATQNPIEYEGTFPLPEAQLDRFLMRLTMGYPSPTDERTILNKLKHEHPITHLQPINPDLIEPRGAAPVAKENGSEGISLPSSQALLRELQTLVWNVNVDRTLQDYIIRLVGKTRQHPDLLLGGSPRASLALFKTAQALAAARGRDYVIPDDIKYLVPATLAHRLIVKPEAELRGRTARIILEEVMEATALDIGEQERS
jgi:MoxR-like ATPase